MLIVFVITEMRACPSHGTQCLKVLVFLPQLRGLSEIQRFCQQMGTSPICVLIIQHFCKDSKMRI